MNLLKNVLYLNCKLSSSFGCRDSLADSQFVLSKVAPNDSVHLKHELTLK